MANVVQADNGSFARRVWRAGCAYVAERNPIRVAREVLALTFRGSRTELERATALRLQAAVLLLFLAVRCVHLGQAGVDLALAGGQYTVPWLAFALGGACLCESVAIAAVTLSARRLTRGAMLADAAFGAAGLAVMAVASSSGPGRAGSLNWMLPYTVATATGLGVLVGGDLVAGAASAADGRREGGTADGVGEGSPTGGERKGGTTGGGREGGAAGRLGREQAGLLLLAVALGGVYVASAYLPHRLGEDHPGQIWGDAANYAVFFAAGALTLTVARGRVAAMSARNAEAAAAAAAVAREAQWRAVAVDVFSPVIALLDRVVSLPDGEPPDAVREEAGRLIAMIEAVRPADSRAALAAESEVGVGATAR
jgi:hypothetical protein